MSAIERNRYIQILIKNGVSVSNRAKIMEDIDASGIFDDPEDLCDYEFDEYELEQEAIVHFGSSSSVFEDNPTEEGSFLSKKRQKMLQAQNERIIQNRMAQKVQEMEKDGIIDTFSQEEETEKRTHYGRNPIHEAISMRNFEQVKKNAEQHPEYMHQTDNNGHTPAEMAYYEGFHAAYEFLLDKMTEETKVKAKVPA